MDYPIIININWLKIIIEKENDIKTIPVNQTPINDSKLNLKRKYYKKGEIWYKRNPIGQWKRRQELWITTTSKTLKFDKIVKQEPLLVVH